VIRDILHRLADRCPSHVVVWPVAVQGEGAAAQVARAVRGFGAMTGSDRPDLVIVARGGGSIEDLWAFNEEEVVRAVAECAIPIISAVGHETDTSLCDFAADVRAPTPTAAAEMAVPVRSELLAQLRETGLRSARCAHRALERAAEQLENSARRLPEREALLAPQQQRLDELAERLPRALLARLSHARADLGHAAGALRPSLLHGAQRRAGERLAAIRLQPALVTRRIEEGRRSLDALWRIAAQAHPDKPLEKGYARVEDREGRTLTSAASARKAGGLRLVFADGRLDASVGDALERPRRAPYPVESQQPKLL
jgi:exodeoxyribonuclease VII large subunit